MSEGLREGEAHKVMLFSPRLLHFFYMMNYRIIVLIQDPYTLLKQSKESHSLVEIVKWYKSAIADEGRQVETQRKLGNTDL